MSEGTSYDLSIFNLSSGIDDLIRGIQSQNPEMSPVEIEALGNSLLGQIGAALSDGEQIASVVIKENGNFDIRIWHISTREDG